MPPTILRTPNETPRNRVADGFGSTKEDAIRCLNAAVDASAIPRKVLAEDLCGMSPSYFSRVINAVEGNFFDLVYRLPADIRRDFLERLAELERADPVAVAAEQLAFAAIRYLTMQKAKGLPAKANHMVKALLAADDKSEIA